MVAVARPDFRPMICLEPVAHAKRPIRVVPVTMVLGFAACVAAEDAAAATVMGRVAAGGRSSPKDVACRRPIKKEGVRNPSVLAP